MNENNNRIKFEQYQGTRILLMDFSHCESFDVIYETLTAAEKFCTQLPPKSALALTDVTGSCFDVNVIEAFKKSAKHNATYIKASATVGVEGLKKVFLPIIALFSGRDIKAFDTREKAMDWLLEQDY